LFAGIFVGPAKVLQLPVANLQLGGSFSGESSLCRVKTGGGSAVLLLNQSTFTPQEAPAGTVPAVHGFQQMGCLFRISDLQRLLRPQKQLPML